MPNKLLSSLNDVFYRSFKILTWCILLWSSFCFAEIGRVDLFLKGNMSEKSGNVGERVLCGQMVFAEVGFRFLLPRARCETSGTRCSTSCSFSISLLFCVLRYLLQQYASVCKHSQNKLEHARWLRRFPSQPCHGTCGRGGCRTFLGTSPVKHVTSKTLLLF